MGKEVVLNFIEKQNMISIYFSKMNILYRKLAKKYGLTYNEMLILYIMKKMSPCTQKQIIDEWELPKQTVNSIIKKLEKEKYISFSFDSNNKEKSIYLTDEGKEFIKRTIDKIESLERNIYNEIGEKDIDITLKIFSNLYNKFENGIKRELDLE